MVRWEPLQSQPLSTANKDVEDQLINNGETDKQLKSASDNSLTNINAPGLKVATRSLDYHESSEGESISDKISTNLKNCVSYNIRRDR